MRRSTPFLRLQIESPAKAELQRDAVRFRLTQAEVISRLLTWLVSQPPAVQAVVLNDLRGDLQAQLSEALLAGVRSAIERRVAFSAHAAATTGKTEPPPASPTSTSASSKNVAGKRRRTTPSSKSSGARRPDRPARRPPVGKP